MSLSFSKIIETIVFSPIEIADDELFFKLDILENSECKYHAMLYRAENYEFKPSFNNEDGFTSNESVYVLDDHTISNLDSLIFDSKDECLNYVIEQFSLIFSI